MNLACTLGSSGWYQKPSDLSNLKQVQGIEFADPAALLVIAHLLDSILGSSCHVTSMCELLWNATGLACGRTFLAQARWRTACVKFLQ